MSYVRKLPSGKFQATVRHPSGRKITKTDPIKRVVVAWAAEQETAFRVGNAPSERGRRLTVESWSRKWLASRNVEPATAAKNATHMRVHVLPRWGTWPLQSVGRIDVQTWVKDMTAAGVGASTVTASYHLFAAMMNDAVLEQVIGASPCREIDLPKVVKPAPRWLTRHEYDRIQLALAVTPRGHVWQAYVALGCFSGLRPGELGGLDVEHVDFDRSLVRVGQVMTRHGLRPYGKTASAARSAPFPPEVGELLWRVVADRGEGAVFTTTEGARVSEINFRNRIWAPALKAAGVKYESPYVMRHTAASWAVQDGVPDFEIAHMLGHSSTRIVGTYAHLQPHRHDRIRAAWASNAESLRRSDGARAESETPHLA